MRRSVAELIGDRFGNYAKYIIQDRALPDVRDGLKPVQRRILYAMLKLHLTPDGQFRKAARVVGEVIGKYHPHGDSSVYEALIRLSQNWRRRYPLVLVQGNNGSIDGDPAAAMRYTESKLAPITYHWLLNYLTPPAVALKTNFDESTHEPVVLAAQLPFALLNGSSGIAAGYATNIPPHNLVELLTALILLVRNPDTTLADILKVILGPDFPTGGTIDQTNLKTLYETGRGHIHIRAKIKICDDGLLIYEIPFEQTKSNIYTKLQQIVLSYPNLNVERVVDESNRFGLKIKLYLKKTAKPDLITNFLFQHSPLAITYHANMVMIVNGRPQRLDLLSYLHHFIRFHTTVLTTHYRHQLKLIEQRLHVLQGIARAVARCDLTIKIIRQAHNRTGAETALQQELNLTPDQAQAVARLRLYQLTRTDLAEIKQKVSRLREEQHNINTLLTDQSKFNHHQIQLWENAIEKLGDTRRTNVVQQFPTATKLPVLAAIDTGQTAELTITRDGYIIGRVITASQKKHYHIKDHDEIMLQQTKPYGGFLYVITNYGQAFRWPLAKLKFNHRSELYQHVSQVTHMISNSKIMWAYWISSHNTEQSPFSGDSRWLMGTSNGQAKIILHSDLKWSERVKKIMKITDHHELISCKLLETTHNNVLVGTKFNRCVKIPFCQIPCQKLTSGGVKLIKLDPHDQVKFCLVLPPTASQLVLIASNYLVKIVDLQQINPANRGTKGRLFYFGRNHKITLKTGFITENITLKLAFCFNNHINQIKLNLRLSSARQLIKQLSLLGSPANVRLFLPINNVGTQPQQLKF